MSSKRLATGTLVLLMVASLVLGQKKSPISGNWELTLGGSTYRIALVEDDGDVSGTVTLPSGEATEIEYGLAFGKEVEFTTVENGVEFEWTAEVSRNSIKGVRENLDEETRARFTGKRIR